VSLFPRRPRHIAVGVALLCAAATASAQTKPPVAPVRDVTDTYFGAAVADPYRYMEDMKNPEVAGWMKAQGDFTRATLDRIPQRDAILKEIQTYGDAAASRVSGVQLNNGYVYYQKRKATENIGKVYVRKGFGGTERLLIDPEQYDANGQHAAVDLFVPSLDNRHLAYGISIGGSEETVLHVLDITTGKETGDVIDRAHYTNVSWLPDGRFLYSRLQKLAPDAPPSDKYQNQRAFVHRLGDDPDRDPVLFGAGVSSALDIQPVELSYAGYSPGSSYVVATAYNGTQHEIRVWVVPLAALAGGKTPWVKVSETSDDVTDIAIAGDTAYVISHKDASRYKVLKLSLAKPDVATANVVVPPSESVVTGIAVAKDALYVRRMNGGISELLRVGYGAGAKPQSVRLPFAGDLDAMSADPRLPGVVFNLGGWTRFGAIYAYDPKAGKLVDTKLQPQGKYDNPSDLVSLEVKARGTDGTLIPLSIVHKKGLKLDGSNPTILYGYGAYGISQTPFYRPTFLPWFERGGILAVPHVRGGGEYGEDWYKAGYKATKPNTWRDAIACAEWLVAHGYTSPPKLAIFGGSAGGIFVGRAITERPDLFGAAIDVVPVSDALRMEFSSNGVPNIPEFGTVKKEDEFKALLAMSPYHHVKDGVAYPAVLLVTGINDPRVDAWEAGKMAARLQAATTSDKPILLRIDYDAGHGIGSTKKSQYEERADIFAFLLWQFGVKGFQP
jgi:prolyl oligopeptidase